MNQPSTLYYFGCGPSDTGHHLWRVEGDYIPGVRWPHPWGNSIDSSLCPQHRHEHGVVSYNTKDGWSGIGFWDSSMDRRSGSHSTFIVDMIHAAEDILALARERFPWVFERIKFDIVLPPRAGQHAHLAELADHPI